MSEQTTTYHLELTVREEHYLVSLLQDYWGVDPDNEDATAKEVRESIHRKVIYASTDPRRTTQEGAQ